MRSLAQMRQCNGCGSVRNDTHYSIYYSTHTCDLARALESASSASWKTPATSIDFTRPNNHPWRNEKSWKKIKLPKIVCYCLHLHKQNPELREADLEQNSQRGSDKIYRLRPRRINTTENKLYRTVWTHKQVPSTQRGRLGTQCQEGNWKNQSPSEPLLIVSKSASESFLQHSLNQSTLVNPIKFSQTWKETNQIPKFHAPQHIQR